jgi:hypothetical protein
MKAIFSDQQSLFADLAGDPQASLKTQQYIDAYLSAQEQGREGFKQKLLRMGIYSLPGIIQSSYTLWDRLKADNRAKEFLRELVLATCRENAEAREFLARAGIADNPFQESRAWLLDIFRELVANTPSESEKKILGSRQSVAFRTSYDKSEVVDLLVLSGDQQEAADVLTSKIRQELEQDTAKSFEAALDALSCIPGLLGPAYLPQALQKFLSSIKWDDSGDRPKAKKNYVEILNRRPIKIGDDAVGGVFACLDAVLATHGSRRSYSGVGCDFVTDHVNHRHKYVESLFVRMVQASLRTQRIMEIMDEEIRNTSFLVMYWPQSVFGAGSQDRNVVSAFFERRDLSAEKNEPYAYHILYQHHFLDRPVAVLERIAHVLARTFPRLDAEAKEQTDRKRTATFGKAAQKGKEKGRGDLY